MSLAADRPSPSFWEWDPPPQKDRTPPPTGRRGFSQIRFPRWAWLQILVGIGMFTGANRAFDPVPYDFESPLRMCDPNKRSFYPACFHLARFHFGTGFLSHSHLEFPLLVLKGIYHYWTYLFISSRGLNQMEVHPVPFGYILSHRQVQLLSNAACAQSYAAANETVTAAMVCASGSSQLGITDTCQGAPWVALARPLGLKICLLNKKAYPCWFLKGIDFRYVPLFLEQLDLQSL